MAGLYTNGTSWTLRNNLTCMNPARTQERNIYSNTNMGTKIYPRTVQQEYAQGSVEGFPTDFGWSIRDGRDQRGWSVSRWLNQSARQGFVGRSSSGAGLHCGHLFAGNGGKINIPNVISVDRVVIGLFRRSGLGSPNNYIWGNLSLSPYTLANASADSPWNGDFQWYCMNYLGGGFTMNPANQWTWFDSDSHAWLKTLLYNYLTRDDIKTITLFTNDGAVSTTSANYAGISDFYLGFTVTRQL